MDLRTDSDSYPMPSTTHGKLNDPKRTSAAGCKASLMSSIALQPRRLHSPSSDEKAPAPLSKNFRTASEQLLSTDFGPRSRESQEPGDTKKDCPWDDHCLQDKSAVPVQATQSTSTSRIATRFSRHLLSPKRAPNGPGCSQQLFESASPLHLCYDCPWHWLRLQRRRAIGLKPSDGEAFSEIPDSSPR